MDVLGEEAIKSIADMCGVKIKSHDSKEEEIEDETFSTKSEAKDSEKTKYVIRHGTENDVLKDPKRMSDNDDDHQGGKISDYTYEEFVEEFQSDVKIENLYDGDVRREAEYEMMDGGTFAVGKLPDMQYLTIKINLPDEDVKTIDIDVKTDKILVFSHKYKCQAYWSHPVKTSQASSTWNSEECVLSIKAPVLSNSSDLNF